MRLKPYLTYGGLIILIALVLLFIFRKNVHLNPPIKVLESNYKGNLPIDTLIKEDSRIIVDIFADSVKNARSMAISPSGTVFVGTRSEGKVYALVDTDKDYIADQKFTIYEGGNMPNGVAFKGGALYVAEVNRILKFSDIEQTMHQNPQFEVVYDAYPTEKHHGWKYIAFGPDDKLYIPVGAPCNICESVDTIFNTLTRLDIHTKEVEIVQKGIRNTVGFTWHPQDTTLWFTDNGRDMMGDDMPQCELNMAGHEGMHFGYPYCHQGDTPDPEFGHKFSCDDFQKPVLGLGPHTAPLGLSFCSASSWPSEYQNNLFIARHGSWNRTKKIGYDVVRVRKDSLTQTYTYTPFLSGWLNTDTDDVWGRPVDIKFYIDGSMLISDDYADVIYRVRIAD